MKKILPFALTCLVTVNTFSQSIGIGTTSPNTSSILDIRSTNKGLLIPRMTTSDISTIASPAKGLMVYDSVKNQLMVNMGSSTAPVWQTIISKSGWSLNGNSGTSPIADFVGTTDSVALIFKVNNKLAGRIDEGLTSNVFFGLQTGNVNAGFYNTGIGFQALFSNTSGDHNIAVGRWSLRANSTGSRNVAIGSGTLANNTTGEYNTAAGHLALFYNSIGEHNSAFGTQALSQNITGSYNTACGEGALLYNNAGNFNTGVGYLALANNSSIYNTAVGANALISNIDGSNNTAIGFQSMHDNTSGFTNTALGAGTLRYNTVGISNTAIGAYALYRNETGESNTAVGHQALLENLNTFNTSVGAYSLQYTINSQYNTAIGFAAGNSYNNGYNNVFVGANTDVNAAGLFNVIAMGQATVVTSGSSTARFGNAATVSYGGWAGWSNISDGRFKKDVREDIPGIDFINRLRPVTYHVAATELDAFLHKNDTTTINLYAKQLHTKALNDKEKIRYAGFIAQEVEATAKELGFDFSGVDAPKNENDTYGLRYAEFVVPLVKAVQELSKQNEELKKQNLDLIKRIEKLELLTKK